MKYLTKLLITAALGTLPLSGPAEAYTYVFLNLLDKPVTIDFCGVAMIGCRMFAGNYNIAETNQHVQRSEVGNFTHYKDAQWLSGPQTIGPGKTVAYAFGELAVGICINVETIKLSIDGSAFVRVKPHHADNVYMAGIIQKIAQLGTAATKVDWPDAEIAGKTVGAFGKLLEHLEEGYAVSQCKDGTFVIGMDAYKKIVIQTADF